MVPTAIYEPSVRNYTSTSGNIAQEKFVRQRLFAVCDADACAMDVNTAQIAAHHCYDPSLIIAISSDGVSPRTRMDKGFREVD
jgi:hypothetical protein